MSDFIVLFLGSVTVLLPPCAGYLIGLRHPPLPEHWRFPSRREAAALLIAGVFTALAGRITGNLLSLPALAPMGLMLVIWFGAFLPPFAAGVAGRRPFVYGGAASLAFWGWTAIFYRDAFVGREWAISDSWTAFLVAEIPFLIALCMLGCMPIYRRWRRLPAPLIDAGPE